MTQQCLTPPVGDTIIATLCAEAAVREKRLARRAVVLQALAALVAAAIAYGLDDARQYALAVLAGGWVSAVNGVLLVWRMSMPARFSEHEAGDPGEAHRQLRLLYIYAAERFVTVVVLLGLCMAIPELPPTAVLGGFAMGQAVLLVARLFWNKSNKF